MAWNLGVTCQTCGQPIEIDEPYIAGVRAAEMAAHYRPFRSEAAEFADHSWEKTLICAACGERHQYGPDDLVLYDAQP